MEDGSFGISDRRNACREDQAGGPARAPYPYPTEMMASCPGVCVPLMPACCWGHALAQSSTSPNLLSNTRHIMLGSRHILHPIILGILPLPIVLALLWLFRSPLYII
eukprot:gene8155-7511_t